MNTMSSHLGPNVLHIGFSKCASTFLQAFFEEHPEIYLVNQSHYFSPFDFSEFPGGKAKYLSLFDKAKPEQLRLESDEHIIMPLFHPVLESAATTLESVREVTRRIKTIAPDTKIIMVVRNQTDLIVSRYSEYILGGGCFDFETFVNEFLECSSDGKNYFQNYYSEIVEILYREFSPDNVFVLLQEELARNEEETIGGLSKFLGVEIRRPSKRGMVSRRVGLSYLGIRIVRAFNRLVVIRQKRSFREAEVRIPFLAYKVIQRLLRIVDYYVPNSVKGDKNAILQKEVETQIRAVFREDNARFAELLSKDVSNLGY